MKLFVFCIAMFFLIILSMLLMSSRFSDDRSNVNDPSALPVPSESFKDWLQAWEKQR